MQDDDENMLLRACQLLEEGSEERAFRLFQACVRRGDVGALHNLGYCYATGQGVTRDLKKAIALYRRAWGHRKDTSTAINIALILRARGRNFSAVKWLRKAIRMRDGEAALELARWRIDLGSKRSAEKLLLTALLWRKTMSEYGVEEAQRLLEELGKG